MTTRGRFITLEGPDGSGKSTQATLLADRLRAGGYEVLQTREPGGTRTGELIRDLVQHTPSQEALCTEAEMLLFAASRAQLTREVIQPALESGTWVVCDRYADSTVVYQGFGREADLDPIVAMNAVATGGLEPDLTVLVDVPVEEGRRRLAARSQTTETYDRMEQQALGFHERVRAGYQTWARRFPERIRVVDGCGSMDEVADAIWKITSEVLP